MAKLRLAGDKAHEGFRVLRSWQGAVIKALLLLSEENQVMCFGFFGN